LEHAGNHQNNHCLNRLRGARYTLFEAWAEFFHRSHKKGADMAAVRSNISIKTTIVGAEALCWHGFRAEMSALKAVAARGPDAWHLVG
jgi:hypothetical protein